MAKQPDRLEALVGGLREAHTFHIDRSTVGYSSTQSCAEVAKGHAVAAGLTAVARALAEIALAQKKDVE